MIEKLNTQFAQMPVVAILRGVRPEEVVDIGEALYSAGIGIIEVPLNSPEPLTSIKRLAQAMSDRCVIGANSVVLSDIPSGHVAYGNPCQVSREVES